MVPDEQLLVYKVGEGWDRLCEFLDKDVPDTEFPHENKAGADDNICKKYGKFDVFQRGNKEALVCVSKLGLATVSIVLFGNWALKNRSLFHFVWK